jgi:serine/threonine-protein kinase
MELVPGTALSDWLSAGPMRASDALVVALAIASALEAAHDRGIVHRDLKPGNVMLADPQSVKILDFGIARIDDPLPDAGTTGHGIVMGTAAYMSPEQARAQAVDRRADIWAFGCVLYELLVGVPPFGRHSSPSDTVAAVLTSEPDLERLPAGTDVDVRRMIDRCLQKDPRRRLQAIGEARLVLEDATTGRTRAETSSRRLAPIAVFVALLLFTAVLAWVFRPASAATPPTLQLATRLSDASLPSFVTISPDGRWLAYIGGDERRLHLRALDSTTVRVLPGTDGAEEPFFSPDGRWLAYVSGGELRKVSVSGDSPITLLTDIARPSTGGDWSSQGIIIDTGDGGFVRVQPDGSPATTIVGASDKGERYGSPQGLSEGLVLVSLWTTKVQAGRVQLIDLDSGRQTTLIEGALGARYAPGGDARHGHLLYQGASGLMALPFDLVHLAATGAPALVAADAIPQQWGRPRFTVSKTGTLVYVAAESMKSLVSVEWLDRTGRTTQIHLPPGDYTAPRISPDGTQLAIQIRDATADNRIGVFDLRRESLRVFPIPGHSIRPVWGPDSRQIAFRSDRGTSQGAFLVAKTDGSVTRVLTTGPITLTFPGSWSGDGGRLIGSGGPVVWAFTPGAGGAEGTVNILERSSGGRDDAAASSRPPSKRSVVLRRGRRRSDRPETFPIQSN